MVKERECSYKNKPCGYMNFTDDVCNLMKRYGIKGVNGLKKVLKTMAIIKKSPFIIENLYQLGKLGKKAKRRYMWGTITNKDVAIVEEFFKDGEK